MPSIHQAFALAEKHYLAGNWSQAQLLYRQIIEADPSHVNAHSNLANTLLLLGETKQAIDQYRQALTVNPNFSDAHYNLGCALSSIDKLDEAIGEWELALHCQPDLARAHNSLAVAKLYQRKLQEAVTHGRQAIQIIPDFAEAHNTLASALLQQGNPQEAVEHCRQALHLRPAFFEAHTNLGNCLVRLESFNEAALAYTEALRLNPTAADALNGLGCALQNLEKLDEAIRCFQEAISLRPHFAHAQNNLGSVLALQHKPEEAIACFRAALQTDPHFAEALTNLGSALVSQDELHEAVDCFRRAVPFHSNLPQALTNLGSALVCANKLEEATDCFDEALRVNPEYPSARWNGSYLSLLRGDFEHGWPEYEWRWSQSGAKRRKFAQPLWDGSPLNGRTIYIYAEQGLGDTIQFIRYVGPVKKLGGKVVIECKPELIRLLSLVPEIDQLVACGKQLPEFQLQVPLLSLPGVFRTTLATIPARVPYLAADTTSIKKWSFVKDQDNQRRDLLVGIAWQGNSTYRYDRQRSIQMRYFERLAQLPGIRLICLQKGQSGGAGVRSEFLLELGDDFDDAAGAFVDTAAVMKHLDLVISSDTSVAHLAGALAIPVWVALPLVPDWRWLLEREDCPWYPTMRLFRQRQLGNWDEVFDRIAVELKKKTEVKR